MDINSLTASRIREVRRNQGLSAEAIARDLGISKTAYSQLENGHVEITLSRIDALAQVLKVPMAELIPNVNSNHQVSHGSGDNYNSYTNNVTNNFFADKDEKLKEVINALTFSLEELKKQERK